MKKAATILLTLLLAYPMYAGFREGYYSSLDGKRKETLKAAAKQSVTNHTRLEYYDLPEYWQYSDVYPELVNGLKRWWEMYSDATYLIRADQTGKQSFSANKMQREHAVPKSWWKKAGSVEYTPAYSDMWNLYPSDAAANQAKLNYAFGEVNRAEFDNGITKVGTPKPGYGGGSSRVFEPADQYKGDFARAIFYMATVYDDINWVYDWMFTQSSYPTLTPWTINMLLQWSRQDPVSQKEIDRNNYVEQYQGNRNPFIDFPNLAEYIWGLRTEETFYVADQENSDPTPPITGDPEITSPVNGEAFDFGQVAVSHGRNRSLRIAGNNLTSPLSLRVSGSDKNLFIPAVTTIPAATMNQNGGYLLNIEYLPDAIGKHEAKLILYDGGLTGSIAVTLKGEALEVPEVKALHALEPANLGYYKYTARWEAAEGIADYYTLTRVRYIDGNAEAESFETGELSYTIDNRNPDVAESYTVTYSRLGIESPVSNTIYIAASGCSELKSEAPFRVYALAGALYIDRATGEGGVLSVYDLSGRLVLSVENPEDASCYMLNAGTYIVAIGNNRPQKLIIL